MFEELRREGKREVKLMKICKKLRRIYNGEKPKLLLEQWQDEVWSDMSNGLHRPWRGPRPPAGRFE